MTTLSLRDRRHQQAQKDLARLETQRDATLDKLTRLAARLKATRRSIERYERTPTRPAAKPAEPVTVPPPAPAPYKPGTSMAAKIDDAMHGSGDLEIPHWLKRAGNIGNKTPADLKALAEIEAAQAERKRNKARAQAEKRKAKASGELKKMPLTGKAALEYLKTGNRPGAK